MIRDGRLGAELRKAEGRRTRVAAPGAHQRLERAWRIGGTGEPSARAGDARSPLRDWGERRKSSRPAVGWKAAALSKRVSRNRRCASPYGDSGGGRRPETYPPTPADPSGRQPLFS
ncbi:hypothetical protein NDU88_001802 [Pleurodeles waltl]|uniref:Uncharacterized protein n=1 Tax=Pleurodeles waltl TaxID=8319 RepID=A0AAV7LAP1_PLEWA|nr:hypothetical protein NDU88_001802 [Pleurodeles waltl]